MRSSSAATSPPPKGRRGVIHGSGPPNLRERYNDTPDRTSGPPTGAVVAALPRVPQDESPGVNSALIRTGMSRAAWRNP